MIISPQKQYTIKNMESRNIKRKIVITGARVSADHSEEESVEFIRNLRLYSKKPLLLTDEWVFETKRVDQKRIKGTGSCFCTDGVYIEYAILDIDYQQYKRKKKD